MCGVEDKKGGADYGVVWLGASSPRHACLRHGTVN
jgi:hypothetical protein